MRAMVVCSWMIMLDDNIFFRCTQLMQNSSCQDVTERRTMRKTQVKRILTDEDDKEELRVIGFLFCLVFVVLLRHIPIRVACGTMLVIAIILHQFYWRLRRYPPGPIPLPLIGNTLSIDTRHPAKTLSYWHAIYGAVYTVWLPHPMIVVASHDALKESLVKQGSSFAGRPSGYIWSMFTHNTDHGDGIILCEGKRWEEIRDFSHKIFRNFGLGKSIMEQKISTHVQYMSSYIHHIMGDETEAELDLEEAISLCVANIIQDFVLGKSFKHGDKQFKKFKKLIDAVLADVASKSIQMINAYPILCLLPIPAIRRYKANGFALQRYFLYAIYQHTLHLTYDGEPQDFMEAYLREMRTNQKGNPNFNEMTLALASGDLWTGGMETTVTTIRWAIIYMLYHPEVQQRCHDEIDMIFGTSIPCYSSRKQTPFVEATITEVLRIVNVLPWAIPHRTLAPTTIEGFELPTGTVVLPQFGTVQFDSHYFNNPHSFNPERFIDNGMFAKRAEMSPFGMGKRSCLGENLARYELYLIFTTLLQQFQFSPIAGKQLPSLERSEGMTNVPKGFECVVRKRTSGPSQ